MDRTGIIIVVIALCLSSLFAVIWQRKSGRVRAVPHGDAEPTMSNSLPPLAPFAHAPMTLLQFSSEVCSQCAATRRMLSRINAQHDDVAYVEIDVVDHMDLVRDLSIMRTPTVFILDEAGVIHFRASGTPRETEVISAVAALAAAPARPEITEVPTRLPMGSAHPSQ